MMPGVGLPSRRGARRFVRMGLVALLGLLLVGYVAAYRMANDAWLAGRITQAATAALRGRIEMERVHWHFFRPDRATVYGFRIIDPAGREAVVVPRATAEVELRGLPGRVTLHDVEAGPGTRVHFHTDPDSGFLATFGPHVRRPPGQPPSTGGPTFHLDGTLPAGTLTIELGEALRVDLPQATTPLQIDVSPGGPRIAFAPRASGGTLTLLGAPLPLESLAVERFTISDDRPHDLQLALAARVAGADARVAGQVLGAVGPPQGPPPEVAITIDLDHAGRAVHGLVGHLLPPLDLGGPNAAGHLQVHGPVDGFRVDADVRDVDLALAGLPLPVSQVAGHLAADPAAGRLELTGVTGHAGGGEVRAPRIAIEFTAGTVRAEAELAHVDLGPLLPPEQRKLLGGRWSGRARIAAAPSAPSQPGVPGPGPPPIVRIEAADLLLDRARRDGLPPRIRLQGQAVYDAARGRLLFQPLRAEAAPVKAEAQGEVSVRARRIDLGISADAAPLDGLLARLGLPGLGRAARLRGKVGGTFDRPRLSGTAEIDDLGLGGLRIPRTSAELALEGRTLRISRLEGRGPHGGISGAGTVQLDRGQAEADVRVSALDLGALGKGLTGHASGSAHIEGPLRAPIGRLALEVPDLRVSGDPYDHADVQAVADARGVSIERLRLSRRRGGNVDGRGRIGYDGTLDLHLTAARFPLQALPGVAGLPVEVRGTLSGSLDVGGTTDAPRPAGTLTLVGAAIRGAALGDGKLEILPGGDAIHLRGSFFDRFFVDGALTLTPRPALALSVIFQQLPLERLVPEMARLGEVRGVATGRLDLSIAATGGLHLSTTLSELRLTAHVTNDDGSPRQIALVNEDEVRVVYDGARLRFDHFHLQSDRGELLVSGYLDPQASDLKVYGTVDLELVEFFAHELFDHTHGQTRADLRVTGPMMRPSVAGTLGIRGVVLAPVGFDHPITIPAGLVTFSNTGVDLAQIQVAVGDAQAEAQGHLGLSDWHPQNVHLQVGGRLSAKLLELLAPGRLAEAQGSFQVSVVCDGPAANPTCQGTGPDHLALSIAGTVELDVRGYGRQVKLTSGHALLSGRTITLRDVRGRIDDGDVRVSGDVRLDNYRLAGLHLAIAATDLPHRDPGIYEVTVTGNLTLAGNAEGLGLSGNVDIVDGKYVQQFDVVRQTIVPRRTREEDVPLWRGVPLFENLVLDLQVNSAGPMTVDNDIARQLKLEANLQVGGTLSSPSMDGEVRVLEGAIRVPFLRGDEFQVLPGSAHFYRDKSIPDETPELNLRAEKDFTDATDQEHMVTLTLRGPLGTLLLELSTNTGLSTSETLVLLLTGRPPNTLRREIGGGGQTSAGGNPADIGVKELSGQFLQEAVSDPIRRFLHIDQFSFSVGAESVDIKGRVRLLDHPRLDLVGLQSIGILNRSTYEGKAELKLHDYIFLDGQIQHFSQGTETEEDVLNRGKAQLRLHIPLDF